MSIATQARPGPPILAISPLAWLRKNLFSSWLNSLLTVVMLFVLYAVAQGVWDFVTSANWGVIGANLKLFMVGRYPIEQVWRPEAAVALLAFLMGASWRVWGSLARQFGIGIAALFVTLALVMPDPGIRLWLAADAGLLALGYGAAHLKPSRRALTIGWLLAIPVSGVLLYGLGGALPVVATDVWGGLLLTFTLAIVGISASFPLGVLLAVGRQSSYPVIRYFCVLYIEIIRGLPLVTILFMAQIMLPLFLPQQFTVERVVRAMVGFILFTSAYLAETVRGGLQSIGRGQSEAARALGLGSLQTLWLIILPQALRAVIPATVGQFISLFKDTSLVAIVGLLDLTGIANSAASQRDFLGLQREVFSFIAVIYLVCAYSMAYASRRLESSLGVGER